MATIKELIDELVLIGVAYEDIKTVTYWDEFDFNAKRADEYPMLLMERRLPIIALDADRNLFTIRVVFHFAVQYLREEETEDTPQDTQADLMRYAFEYFEEFKARQEVQDGKQKWNLPTFSSGDYQFNVLNDRLCDLMIAMDIVVTGTCQEGTFNYPVD